ncbi:MAG: dihydropteroate synthase, partial [Pseudomonadota bacterium]
MGILNVTPDSFSDGGRHATVAQAVDHALAMARAGAQVIDIGGESTRPNADPVSLDEERARTLPVIEQIRARSTVALSIDTSKPALMAEAVAAGATLVNDVNALQAPGAVEAVAPLANLAGRQEGMTCLVADEERLG